MKQKLTYRHDGEKGTAMTYLEILGWARKGLQAEKANYRQMQEKALEGQAHDIAGHCQERIDELEKRLLTEIGFKQVCRSPIGPSVITNTGPQALAVAFYGQARN